METSSKNTVPKPRRILVIGGRPTGLVTLRNLANRGKFERVELVERRDDVSGAWYLDPTVTSPPKGCQLEGEPRWPSPAFPGLIGNVLPEFLSFSGTRFRLLHQLRTSLSQQLRKYTHIYARSRSHIVIPVYGDWGGGARSGGFFGKVREELWDTIVVSIGWYDTPVWPETEGLDLLREKVSHNMRNGGEDH